MLLRMKKYRLLSLVMGTVLVLCGCAGQSAPAAEEGAVSAESEAPTEESSAEEAQEAVPEESAEAAAEETAMSSEGIDTYMTGNYSDRALSGEWERTGSTILSFSGNTVQIEGSGASFDAETGELTISEGGYYVLEGQGSQISLIVRENNDKSVQLVLNGVSLEHNTKALIYAEQCKNLFLTLAEGTENKLSDLRPAMEEEASESTASEASSEDPATLTGAVYSKADLVINGKGSLYLNATYKDGIVGRDDLKLVSGEIVVTAADDALLGRDRLCVKEAVVNLTSGGDGMKSNYDTDNTKGYVIVDGGDIQIDAGSKGIRATYAAVINDGRIGISSGDEGIQSLNVALNGGDVSIESDDDGINISDGSGSSEPGFPGGGQGGPGGGFGGRRGQQGENGEFTPPENGEFTPPENSEFTPPENGEFTPPEDGGSDGGPTGQGMPGGGFGRQGGHGGGPGGGMMDQAIDGCLYIRGGTLYVDAGGDGLDSNGSIEISGGTAYVSGSAGGGDAPLDYNGTCPITGGILVQTGNSGMAQYGTEEDSTQLFAGLTLESNLEQGTEVSVKTKNGSELHSFVLAKAANFIAFTSPEVTAEAEVVFVINGEEKEAEIVSR